ncbi:MAG: recombinase family protein [Candidatus Omnitrophota bacterium]|nr:recombinase family protein [Candidatus Omnitrophota bacterium]
MQGKLQCAIYTRVSTDNQADVEFNSCEAQEEKIKSFIASQENMTIFKVYSDAGFTGANINRPALADMLNDINSGKINLVIAYKIDRLTRSPKDFYQLIELFEKYHIDFISVTERFDTSTPSGRLLRNIMLTFAQFERELTSERTKDKMLQRAQKGMWNGGIVPFGYKAENKKLVINEYEAKSIRSIYEGYIADYPIAKLAKTANVTKSRVYTILRNPVYVGKFKYAGKLWQGNHTPIISEDIFDLAQELHQKVKRTMRMYKDYSLAGLVKCKECNSYMTPCHTNKKKQGKTKRYYYYRCTKTFKKDWDSCATRQVNANRLENYIFDNLGRISKDKQYIENLIFRLNSSTSSELLNPPPKISDSSKNAGENGVAGDRSGLELSALCSEPPKISGEIFAQTLSLFLKTLPQKRGSEKSLWVKKFIKDIVYSKEFVQINFFSQAAAEKEKPAEMAGFPVRNMKNGSPGRARTYDLLVTGIP